MSSTVAYWKQAVSARVVVTVLLVGMGGFFAVMAILSSHDSQLVCQPGPSCRHVERYPLGIVRETPLEAVERADVEWSPGGRVQALALVLHHAGGARSEYQGVGANGERAQSVAEAVNAWLAAPSGPRTFQLREGSAALAIFLAVLALAAFVLLPSSFAKVHLAVENGQLRITVDRWPLRARRVTLPVRAIAGFRIDVFRDEAYRFLCFFLVRSDGGDAVDLGIRLRDEAAARQRLDELEGLLSRWRAG